MSEGYFLAAVLGPVVSVTAVLLGILLNNRSINARIEDFQKTMNSRMDDLQRTVDARFSEANERGNLLRDALRAEMAKNHSELLLKFTELDSCLTRLETDLGQRS